MEKLANLPNKRGFRSKAAIERRRMRDALRQQSFLQRKAIVHFVLDSSKNDMMLSGDIVCQVSKEEIMSHLAKKFDYSIVGIIAEEKGEIITDSRGRGSYDTAMYDDLKQ